MNKRKIIVSLLIAIWGVVIEIISSVHYGIHWGNPTDNGELIMDILGSSCFGIGLAIAAHEWIKGDKNYKE